MLKNVLKKIYLNLPFKKLLFTIIRFFWVPSEKIYRHLYFEGIIKVKSGPDSFFKIHHVNCQIENELFWVGLENAWEKNSMKLWVELSKTSTTIFDIGAYSGIYSLASASLNKNATVYAFEPMKHNYELFVRNLQINNYKNVHPIMKACSNYNGKAKVYVHENTTLTTSVTVNKSLLSPLSIQEEIEIDVITISDFFKDNGISSMDLIKMDVETHEQEVLEGMIDLVKKFKPTLLIEILNDEVASKVMNLLDGLDYYYFDIDENKGITQMSRIKKSSTYNYLVCQKNIVEKLNLLNSKIELD